MGSSPCTHHRQGYTSDLLYPYLLPFRCPQDNDIHCHVYADTHTHHHPNAHVSIQYPLCTATIHPSSAYPRHAHLGMEKLQVRRGVEVLKSHMHLTQYVDQVCIICSSVKVTLCPLTSSIDGVCTCTTPSTHISVDLVIIL